MVGTEIVFNGKFLSAAHGTGVHRVAAELIKAVDRLLAEEGGHTEDRWTIGCPHDAVGDLALSRITRKTIGRLTWQLWEQGELPRFARGKLLINLCNMAPLLTKNSITLIHDAHVFMARGSNSIAFNAWYGFALPRIGSSAARIVTVSEYSREQLVRFGVAPASKITVIPNGADHIVRSPPDPHILETLGLSPRSYTLTVGSGYRHKNLSVLFKAAVHPAMAGLKLVVAGPVTTPKNAALLPPNIIFAGYRTDAELRALYENAACLAFPSTTEGFGLPPVEAMTLGCAVLTSPCGALPSTCGNAAQYIDPNDAAAWAVAIRRLSDDDTERSRLSTAGHRQAAQFSWLESGRALLDVIQATRAEATGRPASRSR